MVEDFVGSYIERLSPFGVQARRVEQRHARVGRADQQVDFRAAEQDRLRAAVDEARHHPPVLAARRVAHHADAQLLVDDVVDDAAIVGLGDQHVETVAVA